MLVLTTTLAGLAVMLVLGWGLAAAGLWAGDQAGSRAEFCLPVRAPARRYQLTAVIGQGGGRLRVFRVPVVSGGSAAAGRPARAARAGDRG